MSSNSFKVLPKDLSPSHLQLHKFEPVVKRFPNWTWGSCSRVSSNSIVRVSSLNQLPNECVLWRTVGDLCDRDVGVITLLKPPRLIHPSLLLVSSSHGGGSSGEIRCSSSSFWRRASVSMYWMPVFVERSGCCLSLSKRMWLTYMKYSPLQFGCTHLTNKAMCLGRRLS
jgi:hypothetical protein